MSEKYRVELDSYNGPLDLLLYLIRREEVDLYDIPIATIAEQYVAYIEVLQRVDPDHVGEFLVMAATLMELKSQMLLPTPTSEDDQEVFEDPRLDLVRQLLEYKRFKDVARQLNAAAQERAQRFGRLPVLPVPEDPGVDLDYVQVWDLLSAFGRMLTQIGLSSRSHEVVYDDTPIALHAEDIIDRLQREDGSMHFEAIFVGRSRSEIIGLFLALLELIRGKRLRAEHGAESKDLVIHLLDGAPLLASELEDHRIGGQESRDPEGG